MACPYNTQYIVEIDDQIVVIPDLCEPNQGGGGQNNFKRVYEYDGFLHGQERGRRSIVIERVDSEGRRLTTRSNAGQSPAARDLGLTGGERLTARSAQEPIPASRDWVRSQNPLIRSVNTESDTSSVFCDSYSQLSRHIRQIELNFSKHDRNHTRVEYKDYEYQKQTFSQSAKPKGAKPYKSKQSICLISCVYIQFHVNMFIDMFLTMAHYNQLWAKGRLLN